MMKTLGKIQEKEKTSKTTVKDEIRHSEDQLKQFQDTTAELMNIIEMQQQREIQNLKTIQRQQQIIEAQKLKINQYGLREYNESQEEDVDSSQQHNDHNGFEQFLKEQASAPLTPAPVRSP